MKDPPSTLLILADQWGDCWTGCGGSRVVATPHLDALADADVETVGHRLGRLLSRAPTSTNGDR